MYVGLWVVCQRLVVELLVLVLCTDLVVVVSSVTWVVWWGVFSRVRSLVVCSLVSIVSAGVGHEWYVLWFLVVVNTLLVFAKVIAS